LKSTEHQKFVHARDQLLGLVGCGVVIGYASYVLAGEPAHEAAHPFYQVRKREGENRRMDGWMDGSGGNGICLPAGEQFHPAM
jgi:hypothetical protein